MSEEIVISQEEIGKTFEAFKKQAESGGYFLNPDAAMIKELFKGLLTNQKRFGYMACPCRLAAGKKEEDLDIVCPCDYRDADLTDFGACF